MIPAWSLVAVFLTGVPGEPVRLDGGLSPDGQFEVVLEADLDTPGHRSYEFKGGDEDFPAFQVLEKRKAREQLARVPWPGDSSDTSLAPLRERTRILWRGDSHAVAINTRDPHYWTTILLARDRSGAFVRVPLPNIRGDRWPASAKAGRPSSARS